MLTSMEGCTDRCCGLGGRDCGVVLLPPPPIFSDDEFMHDLRELEDKLLDVIGRPIVIMGNFNARAPAWDSGQANRRGRLLTDWMGLMELQLVNVGTEPTCVHPRGVSCVDITMASPSAARKITTWRVATELEFFLDHSMW